MCVCSANMSVTCGLRQAPGCVSRSGIQLLKLCRTRPDLHSFRWPPTHFPFSLDEFHPPIQEDLRKLKFLSADDPGFFLEYTSDAVLHNICGLPNSAVRQGSNAAESAAALKQFVQKLFSAASPNCPVRLVGGALSEVAFERLSNMQVFKNLFLNNIVHQLWHAQMIQAGLSAGRMYVATPTPGGASPQMTFSNGLFLFRD